MMPVVICPSLRIIALLLLFRLFCLGSWPVLADGAVCCRTEHHTRRSRVHRVRPRRLRGRAPLSLVCSCPHAPAAPGVLRSLDARGVHALATCLGAAGRSPSPWGLVCGVGNGARFLGGSAVVGFATADLVWPSPWSGPRGACFYLANSSAACPGACGNPLVAVYVTYLPPWCCS